MKVQGGSKMRDLLELALEDFAAGKDVLWSGSGAALVKVVTCAEVVKRKFHPVHQFNSISYTKVDELWEPKIEGLDALVVVRDVPTIHILLSHQPVNADLPGYQSAGERVKPSGGRSKRTPKANIPPHLEKAGLSFNRGKPRPPKDQKEPHQ